MNQPQSGAYALLLECGKSIMRSILFESMEFWYQTMNYPIKGSIDSKAARPTLLADYLPLHARVQVLLYKSGMGSCKDISNFMAG